mmetsp:Transcript_40569/g.67814  ORF Transcript_40569/g.67814 Transcript_40569/m.67814 type:complete len:195 (-) Transcript_40569:1366-1950(-)
MTKPIARSAGCEWQVGVTDLPDSVLEQILLCATGDSETAVILVCRLAGVSRRFRRIVFSGALWPASDLSELLSSKEEMIYVLFRMDLSKVTFAGSMFSVPDKTVTEFSLQHILSLFDIVGPYMRELRVGPWREFDDEGAFSASNVIENVGVILQRYPSVSGLEIAMLLRLQSLSDVLASLPLMCLRLRLALRRT